MTHYYLVERNESDNGWTLHRSDDGTEIGSWDSEPTEKQIREAMAFSELPNESNLPDAASQASAIGQAIAGDYFQVQESHPRFPFW